MIIYNKEIERKRGILEGFFVLGVKFRSNLVEEMIVVILKTIYSKRIAMQKTV